MAATLKAGGAGATQSTKLMLPHEMLATPGGVGGGGTGHSTLSFFSAATHHHHLTTHNHSAAAAAINAVANAHSHSFQGSFSSFSNATSIAAAAANSLPNTHTNHSSAAAALLQAENGGIKSEPAMEDDDEGGESKENSADVANVVGTEPAEEEPEIDIVISNVVCSFSVRCHLNLRSIALNGCNVEFRRENGMVTMKLRRPYTTASIWSSGRITCTGATSEDQVSTSLN